MNNWKQLGILILVVGAAAWFTSANASEQAQTNYDNQIASCQSGNVVRYVLHDFAEAATEARTESAEGEDTPAARATDLKAAGRYARDQQLLERIPGGRPNGTRDCLGQIEEP